MSTTTTTTEKPRKRRMTLEEKQARQASMSKTAPIVPPTSTGSLSKKAKRKNAEPSANAEEKSQDKVAEGGQPKQTRKGDTTVDPAESVAAPVVVAEEEKGKRKRRHEYSEKEKTVKDVQHSVSNKGVKSSTQSGEDAKQAAMADASEVTSKRRKENKGKKVVAEEKAETIEATPTEVIVTQETTPAKTEAKSKKKEKRRNRPSNPTEPEASITVGDTQTIAPESTESIAPEPQRKNRKKAKKAAEEDAADAGNDVSVASQLIAPESVTPQTTTPQPIVLEHEAQGKKKRKVKKTEGSDAASVEKQSNPAVAETVAFLATLPAPDPAGKKRKKARKAAEDDAQKGDKEHPASVSLAVPDATKSLAPELETKGKKRKRVKKVAEDDTQAAEEMLSSAVPVAPESIVPEGKKRERAKKAVDADEPIKEQMPLAPAPAVPEPIAPEPEAGGKKRKGKKTAEGGSKGTEKEQQSASAEPVTPRSVAPQPVAPEPAALETVAAEFEPPANGKKGKKAAENDGGKTLKEPGPAQIVALPSVTSSETQSLSKPLGSSKKARKSNPALKLPTPPPEPEQLPEPSQSDDENIENEVAAMAADSSDDEDVHLRGFSTDDDDSSDEDDAMDDEAAPLDTSKLPTIAKDDIIVKQKLEKAKRQPTQDRGVLYLGRIPHGFYEDQLRAYFTQFGDITRLRISRNKKTGRSKHYGFIEFDSSSVAQIVAETMNNFLLMGHILQCRVIPKDEVHPELWVGANRRWRVIPRDRISRVQHNKPRTEEEREKAENRLINRQNEKKRKLGEAGIKYDFDEIAYKKKAKAAET